MSELLDDLHIEAITQDDETSKQNQSFQMTDVLTADFSVLGKFTALQRAAKFLSFVPLNQLLFYLATISYRKVR